MRLRYVLRALVAMLLAATLLPGIAAAGKPESKKSKQPMVWGDLYPASPADLVVKQPDGSKFKARLTGAEVGGALEHEGYTVTKRSDGWWVFATGRNDEGSLVGSDARVGLDARPDGLARSVGLTPNIWTRSSDQDIRTQMFEQLRIASAKAQAQAAAGGPRLFKFPVLMLSTWWDTDKGQTVSSVPGRS